MKKFIAIATLLIASAGAAHAATSITSGHYECDEGVSLNVLDQHLTITLADGSKHGFHEFKKQPDESMVSYTANEEGAEFPGAQMGAGENGAAWFNLGHGLGGECFKTAAKATAPVPAPAAKSSLLICDIVSRDRAGNVMSTHKAIVEDFPRLFKFSVITVDGTPSDSVFVSPLLNLDTNGHPEAWLAHTYAGKKNNVFVMVDDRKGFDFTLRNCEAAPANIKWNR